MTIMTAYIICDVKTPPGFSAPQALKFFLKNTSSVTVLRWNAEDLTSC